MLKVNLLQPTTPESGVITHPTIVAALCKLLNKFDTKIMIGDSSGCEYKGGTKTALELSGINKICDEFGAIPINFDTAKKVILKETTNKVLKKISVPYQIKNADVIISVPKLKTHCLTKYTGAIKNMMGVLPGRAKIRIHELSNKLISKRMSKEEAFARLIVDIYQAVKPDMALMDGVVGMEGNGPAHGRLKKAGLILASDNCVAMDIVASRMMGFRLDEVEIIKEALRRKLISDREIYILGREVKLNFKKPYIPKIPDKIKDKSSEISPYINHKKCIRCQTCIQHCPVNCIDNKYNIDYTRCIGCFCCSELCPKNAIGFRKRIRLINIIK